MKLNQLRMRANEKGFTLIELMIVVAIIGILAAIAIPNFLGMQEKAKRRSIEEAATSAKAELHSWILASINQEPGVVDVDGNGVIDADEMVDPDLTLIPQDWKDAFTAKRGDKVPTSPWDGQVDLFTVGGPAAPGTADGTIILSYINAGRGIKIFGTDNIGTTLYQDTVSAD